MSLYLRGEGQRQCLSCPMTIKVIALLLLSILSFLWSSEVHAQTAECPPSELIPGCPCYNFEDGLFLECSGATEDTLRSTLLNIMNSAGENTVVQSLSVYELDKAIEELRGSSFPSGSQVRHLQISHSALRDIGESAFSNLRISLESLALVSARLAQVPQKALGQLENLAALDLEANQIQELTSYCFYGLKLMKLSLKANKIAKVSEHAFAGLEGSLAELDMAENKLRRLPMTALRRLESLDSLKLAWNDISELPDDGYSRLQSLVSLDLSSNNFERLGPDCFRPCPRLQTLSLYYNRIEDVDPEAFASLRELESLDLSFNRIVALDTNTFKANQRLRSIEISHNRIHYIGGLFSGLPELHELYLTENNILEVPAEAFVDSANLSVLYLQQNAIQRIDARALVGLSELEQLLLSKNYIERLPAELFENCCSKLASLSLDDNRIKGIVPATFSRLDRLREIRLQFNRIAGIGHGVFSRLPALQELDLANNDIAEIEAGSFSSLASLQHINLDGNKVLALDDLFEISSQGNSSLRVIWLGKNKLTHLQAPLFRDLQQVERLYLNNNSIARVDDGAFQSMHALKFLDLSYNRLVEIDVGTFAELRELEELHLEFNDLRRLAPYVFADLKRLRVLDLSNNPLTVLHDSMFQEGLPIRTLLLRNCSLSIIEPQALDGLNELVKLDLDDNGLDSQALLQLQISGLQVLTASRNNFSLPSENSLRGLPSLLHLEVDGARLSQLPETLFALNANLVKVQLRRNGLHNLPPGLFGNLMIRELRLDWNQLTALPYEALAAAKALEILSMGHNELSAVDLASLASLAQLRELDLSANRIKSVSGFAMANFSRLLSVDFSNNELSTLPANFFARSSSLRRVDLSGNRFRQIPALPLPSLGLLNLTGNPLGRIGETTAYHQLTLLGRSYPLLQDIHLSATNLTILTSQDFEAFPALQGLYLDQNSITRISPGAFRNLPNLVTLHLGMNNLDVLPQERLRHLFHLRILNATRNRLRDLDDFPEDLASSLQVLDLSFNQISSLGKNTFQHLESIVELHLYGNRISHVAADAFKHLKKLRLLDLSRNSLENFPLNAFRPPQIRSLRAEENPLNCDCQSQELWQWLRDHQKLVGGVARGQNKAAGVQEVDSGLLRCEQPPELRGLVFLDLEPHSFCSVPLVLKLAIQDIQPFSVLVSWQSRNYSGLHGYQVAYHALGNVDEVRGKLLEPKARSVRLTRLSPDTRYLICVLGLGSWSNTPLPQGPGGAWPSSWNTTDYYAQAQQQQQDELLLEGPTHPVMVNSPMSRCTEVRTLDAPGSQLGDGPAAERGNLASILTRRLGLIVGCCMGFVVFVVLISVLGYMKMKKERAAIKREQPLATNPPEYMTYRHFSLQSGDRTDNACPSFIT